MVSHFFSLAFNLLTKLSTNYLFLFVENESFLKFGDFYFHCECYLIGIKRINIHVRFRFF